MVKGGFVVFIFSPSMRHSPSLASVLINSRRRVKVTRAKESIDPAAAAAIKTISSIALAFVALPPLLHRNTDTAVRRSLSARSQLL